MPTAKEEVRSLLDKLPDDVSFEDIQYHIFVREKIERGLRDAEQGRWVDQEEIERRMSRWLGPQGGPRSPGRTSRRRPSTRTRFAALCVDPGTRGS